MAAIASRADFKEYCLRRIGKGAVTVNVTDDQVDDRINDALQKYADYHYDGSEHVYYKYQITAADRTNKYITLPDNIIGAVRIFPIGMTWGGSAASMFNIQYQIALNDMWDLTNSTMAPYYLAMQNIQMIEQLLVGEQPIRFSRHTNQLHIDMDWTRIENGQYIIVEAYQVIDPDEFTDVWDDMWLKKYATALIKLQWGENLTKFIGQKLPGGMAFNGERILSDAQKEVEDLEKNLIFDYSLPAYDMIA